MENHELPEAPQPRYPFLLVFTLRSGVSFTSSCRSDRWTSVVEMVLVADLTWKSMEVVQKIPWMWLVQASAWVAFLAFLHVFVVPKLRYWNFSGPKPYNFLLGSIDELATPKGRLPHLLLALRHRHGRVFHVWFFQRRMVQPLLHYTTDMNPS